MPEEGLTPENPESEDAQTSQEEVPSVDDVDNSVVTEEPKDETPVAEESNEAETEASSETPAEPTSETEAEPEAPVEDAPADATEATDAPEEQDGEPVEPEAPAETTAEAATETEASEDGDASDGDAEEATLDIDPPGNEAASSLLAEILGDEDNFDSVVEKANPNELALLMETIAERGNVGEFISKVGLIKRDFDKKTDGDTADKSLLERFSTALARFNKKRKAYYAEREKEKEENSTKKYALLERLKIIVLEEQVTKIGDVRQIQSEWRKIGWVLQKDIQPLNETYRQYLDVFYNLRSKYQELLDLDREYNYKKKLEIIDKVDALIPEEESSREVWNDLSSKVRAFQDEWKQAGQVPRDKVSEVNSSYRDVLDRFYETRKGYFELQDAQREDNAAKKRELLEQLKVYSDFASTKARDWNEATKTVLEIQEKWKGIGPGPLEENKVLWKEYRALCDNFFTNKGKFFKDFDQIRSENLKKKIEICEKAEALQESDDWKKTAQVLKDLQREWKTIGPVHERHSNKVWKRFRKACDTFFDRRSDAMSADRDQFSENLATKEALIKELQELGEAPDAGQRMDDFNAINTKWKATGHVPFKQKDKINNAFKEAIGNFFDKAKISKGDARRMRMKADINSITNEDQRTRRIKGEIRKVQGKIRAIQSEVDTYEVNILYIAKGRKGDTLRNQIQAQIDSEKARIADEKKRLKELRHLLDNPPQPEEEAKAEAVSEEEE